MIKVDLVVLGGGINGTAIAREAAERGLSVVLLETHDLASATSSASSKLIHGGLRYLAQGHLHLVRESLQERERLLRHAPHLVKPLSFVMPTNQYDVKDWQVGVGLWLYDHLANRGTLHKSVRVARKDKLLQPLLPTVTSARRYQDCWGDDARLVISNALAAQARGATIYNYVSDYQIKRQDTHWQITIAAPNTLQIQAKLVVNATGPWAIQALEQVTGNTSPYRLSWVKGSHLVVPRFYEQDVAYTLPQSDGRIVFVIPYLERYCMIGTTDIHYHADPRQAHLDRQEQDYLLTAVSRYFQQAPHASQILWHFSGVRALVADKQDNPSKTSREYQLVLDTQAAPILSVFGGKLTTHRSLAEKAVNQCKSFFPQLQASISACTPLPGGDIQDWLHFEAQCIEQYPFIPRPTLQRYMHTYGTRIQHLLHCKYRLEDLGAIVTADLYQHEVDFLRKTEWAKTDEDILWRRTKLGLSCLMSPSLPF